MSAPASHNAKLASEIEALLVSAPGPYFITVNRLLAVDIMNALRAQSNGPSERDAVLEEAAKLVERDYIPGHSVAGPEAAFSRANRIRALKNAAPQGGTSSGVERPSNGEVGGSSPQPVPAAAASEAGADDARDAARYRWLRGGVHLNRFALDRQIESEAEMDAAIDAELAKSNATDSEG